MDALLFIVDTVLTLAVYAFLLRLLLQLSRADFRNPLAQAVLRLTSWLVLPLRRVLPPVGRLDTASVAAVLLLQLASTAIVFFLTTRILMPLVPLLQAAVIGLVVATAQLYTVAVIIYALLSLLAPQSYGPAVGLLSALCEPLLRPVRSVLPALGGLDFSPLVVVIGLQALKILVT